MGETVMIEPPRRGGPWAASLVAFLWLFPNAALAQSVGDTLGKESITNRPIFLVLSLAGIALVPFLVVMTTSFIKITLVSSILRQAIGTAQIPPTQILTGLSIILTSYIMAPVGLEVYHEGKDELAALRITQPEQLADPENAVALLEIADGPVRAFLVKHTHTKERVFFFNLGRKMREGRAKAEVADDDYRVLVPAFVMSELFEAFQIGFILFLPFLVIDMVIANILMALGMQMLSPQTIALPFKLLLFVMVDGWHVVTKGLILGYL